ncbi:MAG: glycine cleavage system aminomethyltransferase GcvT [Phycisphaeraceae bacterium]|nr:MAG: glycine cleavage system aminomethyltransferase GcvT [Phycisphaeraceae bacterium]
MHKSPIHDFHVQHGAQMVEFAGWEMPIKYTSIIDEHNQVRNAGGMFDVSHMGRLEIKGLHAKRLLEHTCSRIIGSMQHGQCRYSFMCNEQGGVKDDVIVMRLDDDEFMVVVNASNREKIVAHLDAVKAAREFKVNIDDKTFKTAMVAAQGPRIMALIGGVSKEIPTLKKYRFTTKNLLVLKLIVSRTGYTGEDGVEVILPASGVNMAMKLLMKDVDPDDPDAPMKPAGLGARDTLRIEAGMPLYGHELGEEINALATGFDFAIGMNKNTDEHGETFIGQQALQKTVDDGGPKARLIGLEIDSKRTARQHMKVLLPGGDQIGEITSGCLSPTLGKSIAMAYAAAGRLNEGDACLVDTGKATLEARVVPLPFYKRD